jgi:hypothetical protein
MIVMVRVRIITIAYNRDYSAHTRGVVILGRVAQTSTRLYCTLR